MERIYAPKPSCPRDLGFWYCDDCVQAHQDEQSCVDFLIPITGCGRRYTKGAVCGETHMGYRRCDECEGEGRESHPHIHEFEVVGEIRE